MADGVGAVGDADCGVCAGACSGAVDVSLGDDEGDGRDV